MFSRGNWSVLGLDIQSLPAFEATLNDARKMLSYSQLAADAVVRQMDTTAIGINPYCRPRLDEDCEMSSEERQALADFKAVKHEDPEGSEIDPMVLEFDKGFRYGVGSFQIAPGQPIFGLWFVYNEFKDVGDRNSLREDLSYCATQKPYKFLAPAEKKTVEADAKTLSATVRKQFPVILDFTEGRIYVEQTSKSMILLLKDFLELLGVETYSVAWKFDGSDWIRSFFARIYEDSRYKEEFARRAQDTTRFGPDEIEKLEDLETEKIVSTYFAMTELESESWVGLASPAHIRLFPTSSAVVAPTSPTATLLLGTGEQAQIYSASIAFQERRLLVNKKGEERILRNTIFSLDVGDGINELDAGAALLRGFDLPGFKKGIQREIRKSKEVPPIDRFWFEWLSGTKNAIHSFAAAVRDTLQVEGGLLRLYEAEGTEEVLVPDAPVHLHRVFRGDGIEINQ